MGLADTTLATWLGLRPPGAVTLGLVDAGREISDVGYARASGDWAMDGSQAGVTVSFGPFTGPVRFDAVRVFDDGEPVTDIPVGIFQLPAGASHEQNVSIAVVEVN
jgi:hypothetical protein